MAGMVLMALTALMVFMVRRGRRKPPEWLGRSRCREQERFR